MKPSKPLAMRLMGYVWPCTSFFFWPLPSPSVTIEICRHDWTFSVVNNAHSEISLWFRRYWNCLPVQTPLELRPFFFFCISVPLILWTFSVYTSKRMRCQSATSNAKQKDRRTEMKKKETIMWSIHINSKENNQRKIRLLHSLFLCVCNKFY